jgi:hypothetical protein
MARWHGRCNRRNVHPTGGAVRRGQTPGVLIVKPVRVLLLSLFPLTISVVASARLEDAGDVDIHFLAVGPAGMKINGEAPTLRASEHDGKLDIEVPLAHVKTGIGLRDRHLKKDLETDKYPDATLVVERKKLTFPENDKEVSGVATGDFTLHGVSKPLRFQYKVLRPGSDYHVQALATIDIREHGVEVPCYLGVCVEPSVKLKLKFKLREK